MGRSRLTRIGRFAGNWKRIRRSWRGSPDVSGGEQDGFGGSIGGDLAGFAELRLPGKHIFAISAVAGSGLRPLLEEIWQRVEKLPVAESLVIWSGRIFRQWKRGNAAMRDMFKYVESDADETAWEAVDAEETAIDSGRSGLINAAGEEIAKAAGEGEGQEEPGEADDDRTRADEDSREGRKACDGEGAEKSARRARAERAKKLSPTGEKPPARAGCS